MSVHTEKCQLDTEKCQFDTEKCQLSAEKCQLYTEKCRLIWLAGQQLVRVVEGGARYAAALRAGGAGGRASERFSD